MDQKAWVVDICDCECEEDKGKTKKQKKLWIGLTGVFRACLDESVVCSSQIGPNGALVDAPVSVDMCDVRKVFR
eukprot:1359956-Amphidinium_carterae.3